MTIHTIHKVFIIEASKLFWDVRKIITSTKFNLDVSNFWEFENESWEWDESFHWESQFRDRDESLAEVWRTGRLAFISKLYLFIFTYLLFFEKLAATQKLTNSMIDAHNYLPQLSMKRWGIFLLICWVTLVSFSVPGSEIAKATAWNDGAPQCLSHT